MGDIIEVNSSIALKAGELRRQSKEIFNRSLKLPDALIAATAIEHAAVLVGHA
ncbi:MAG: PIN domain-containing protein [Bacillota bacterium]